MDLRELRQREDLNELLCSTLSQHFERRVGAPCTVTATERHGAQAWFEHRLFGAFTSPTPSRAVRSFLASLYRFTDRPLRVVPQAVAVTLAATQFGTRRLSSPALWMTPGLERADLLAIVPGNQRVRLLDFGTQTTHVFQKTGFALDTLQREWAAREARDGPFLPILEGVVSEGWLSEPIVDGWALARCPPWIDRAKIVRDALRRLAEWGDGSAREMDAHVRASNLVDTLALTTRDLDARFGSALGARVLEVGKTIAGGMCGTVVLSCSHGDLQPGNIIVPRDGSAAVVIDLEHALERSRQYDALTMTLRSRSAHGFAERAGAYLESRLSVSGRERESRAKRRLALGMFVLEDLSFFTSESLTGPFRAPSAGLELLMGELNRLVLQQGAWWQGL